MVRYNVLALVALATIYSVAAQTDSSPGFDCPPGEVYSVCGNICEATCTNQNPRSGLVCRLAVCTAISTGGCTCKEGEVRSQPGVCIPAANCPTS